MSRRKYASNLKVNWTAAQDAYIKREAERTGLDMADVVRRAVQDKVESQPRSSAAA